MTRTYPKMEFVFQEGQTEPFLRRVEKTCKQLAQIASSGSAAEKERAAAALAAYAQGLSLVRELAEARFRMAGEATSATARR
jgi:hypothetical protein